MKMQTWSIGMLMLLGCLSTPAGRSAADAPPTPVPQFTPYEKNMMLFGSVNEAIWALGNRDIMIRRSGVEWLGHWTATDGWSASPDTALNQKRLHGRSDIVAPLIRAVREMPISDVVQATKLLGLVGPAAKPAIPAICDALSSCANDQFVERAAILEGLDNVCGGPDKLAATVSSVLRDPDTGNRVSAARGLQYCVDRTQQQWNDRFQKQAIPALARALDNSTEAVRLAAADAVASLTEHFVDNALSSPWQTTVAPLTRMTSSTDPVEQLAGVKALACVPADVSPASDALFDALDRDDDQRQSAIAGLTHAAQSHCSAVVDVFTARLKVRGARRRTTYSEDISLAAVAVWSASPDAPNVGSYGERLTVYPPHYPAPMAARKRSEMVNAQGQFLDALLEALRDPVRGVREGAVEALVRIERYDAGRVGTIPISIGKAWNDDRLEKSQAAREKAEQILADSDPDLAKKVKDAGAVFSVSRF